MKYEYQVLFQRNCEVEEGNWLNGGMLYRSKRVFTTLEEAEDCKNEIIAKETKPSKTSTQVVNGIGITTERDDCWVERLALRNIKIRKRQVTEWEEV